MLGIWYNYPLPVALSGHARPDLAVGRHKSPSILTKNIFCPAIGGGGWPSSLSTPVATSCMVRFQPCWISSHCWWRSILRCAAANRHVLPDCHYCRGQVDEALLWLCRRVSDRVLYAGDMACRDLVSSVSCWLSRIVKYRSTVFFLRQLGT